MSGSNAYRPPPAPYIRPDKPIAELVKKLPGPVFEGALIITEDERQRLMEALSASLREIPRVRQAAFNIYTPEEKEAEEAKRKAWAEEQQRKQDEIEQRFWGDRLDDWKKPVTTPAVALSEKVNEAGNENLPDVLEPTDDGTEWDLRYKRGRSY